MHNNDNKYDTMCVNIYIIFKNIESKLVQEISSSPIQNVHDICISIIFFYAKRQDTHNQK